MFALRRIAARAVFAQPARQLSTLRPAHPRTSIFHSEQASLLRSFHQSQRWLAEKDEASPEEPATTEPSAAEQENIREESITTPDAVEATEKKADDVLSRAQDAAGSAAETVRDMASSAAETISHAASTVTGGPPASWPPRQTPAQSQGKVVYVGNLFFQTTEAQLKSEFGKFGEIVNSRLVTDFNGQSKGFGFIEFANEDSASRAIQDLDQTQLDGRRIAVQLHSPKDGPRGAGARRGGNDAPFRERRQQGSNEPAKTLFIGNMSYQMSDRDLNDLFREIKNVLDVRVAIDRRSGQPRGFAHADFIDVASATKAKEHLEQKVVYGRQLRVDFSQSSSQRIS